MRTAVSLVIGLLAFLRWPDAARAGDAALADTEPWVICSVGTFALVDDLDYPLRAGLQYRSRPRTDWALRPGIGVSAGAHGMGYVYADLARDFALPQRWALTLSFAAGYFVNGDFIGVSEPLEFQSGIAFSRRLDGGVRIGLAVHHISNGGRAHPNNGTETLVVFVAVPVTPSR